MKLRHIYNSLKFYLLRTLIFFKISVGNAISVVVNTISEPTATLKIYIIILLVLLGSNHQLEAKCQNYHCT